MITSILVSINAMLVALEGFLIADTLDGTLSDGVQVIIGVVVAVVIAGIGPLLPKVSGTFRSAMGLQRRG